MSPSPVCRYVKNIFVFHINIRFDNEFRIDLKDFHDQLRYSLAQKPSRAVLFFSVFTIILYELRNILYIFITTSDPFDSVQNRVQVFHETI